MLARRNARAFAAAEVDFVVSNSAGCGAALRDAGQTVWYMNALNEGHGYRKKENRDIYQQATVLFFKTHHLGE